MAKSRSPRNQRAGGGAMTARKKGQTMGANKQQVDQITQTINKVEERDTLLEVGRSFLTAAKAKGVGYGEILQLTDATFPENERGEGTSRMR